MAARQNVAFKPSLQRVLAQHFHHAPGDIEFATVGVIRPEFGQPGFLRGGIDGCEPVGRSLIGSKHTEGTHVTAHYLGEKVREHIGGLRVNSTRRFDFDRVVAKVWQFEFSSQHSAVGVRIGGDAPWT